jgi:TPR repeat protein
MFINKIIIAAGLSVLLTACSTGKVNNSPPNPYAEGTPTQLGERYLLGRGVPQDDSKAFYYFSQADNDPRAQNELAYMYAAGKGTTQNYNKAFYYYKKAAEQGVASAQYNLGLLYWRGLGTEQNKALALEWFTKSADQGFEPAKRALKKYNA